MEYLHTMVRVADLGNSLDFYVEKLGLVETRRPKTKPAVTPWCISPRRETWIAPRNSRHRCLN